jgi:hypothetical protein
VGTAADTAQEAPTSPPAARAGSSPQPDAGETRRSLASAIRAIDAAALALAVRPGSGLDVVGPELQRARDELERLALAWAGGAEP